MSDPLELWEAILLGLVEGLTEFLPVSSTGHLTVTEKLLGYQIDAPDVTAFTAIIQMGAILATLVYFRSDIARFLGAFFRGLARREARTGPDWRFAIALLVGSLPIGIVGLVLQDPIETTLRNLWFVGGSLIAWSGVMLLADRTARLERGEDDVRLRDTLLIGITQCLALIPGVSRSGATLSAGLLLGLDRVTATRLAFFLAIPALTAATLFQIATNYENIAGGVGWTGTIVALVISFFVGYMVVAWLLRFVASHTFTVFIVYRVVAGSLILALLGSGTVDAT